MRIIAGEFRSRKLLSPPEDTTTRPIPDRVKESLFSILRGHIEGAEVLDLFAGTGSVGLEAVSRGAARCVFVERDRSMAAVLQKNIETLGAQDRCEVVTGDALGAGTLARCPRPATIIMMDPPYDLVRSELGARRVKGQLAELVKCLTDDGFAVLRTPWPLFYTEEEAAEPGVVYGARTPSRPGRAGPPRLGPDGKPRRDRPARPTAKGRWDEVWTIEKSAPKDLEELIENDGATEDEVDPASDAAPPAAGAAAPKPKPREIDLAVEAAVGPETHQYGTMALHFYMKRK